MKKLKYCPRCKGIVWLSIENGARQLGENPSKKYKRYNCDECKLFWAEGDVIVLEGEA